MFWLEVTFNYCNTIVIMVCKVSGVCKYHACRKIWNDLFLACQSSTWSFRGRCHCKSLESWEEGIKRIDDSELKKYLELRNIVSQVLIQEFLMFFNNSFDYPLKYPIEQDYKTFWSLNIYHNGAINSRSWKVAAPLTFQTKMHFLGRQKRPNS